MAYKMRHLAKNIAVAGTRERLTTSNVETPSMSIQALTGNTGIVYVGDNQVSGASFGAQLDAGESVSLGSIMHGLDSDGISMKDAWLDVATSGDGVTVLYLEKQ